MSAELPARTADDAGTGLTIQLSLISHTNVGKTSLARTLLREDIGEVSDRPHVTDVAERHLLVESAQGERLMLWDTPGFGDSVRLLRRLKHSGNPIGWFMTQVWDRFTDRPFWCSQQALRNAREDSDVVLYVVNASEDPAAAGYVDAEMQILAWVDKPIVLLLNQLGTPRGAAQTHADVQRWQQHLAAYPLVRAVLPFDAFARCWVQEGVLLAAVQAVLPGHMHAAFERLRAAWRDRNLTVFECSMEVLAQQLATVAVDEEMLAARRIQDRARAWLGSVVTGAERTDVEVGRAQRTLAARLDAAVRSATEELVRLHGLTGRATEEVLRGIGREFAVTQPADADKAGVIGGLVSGAVGGLAADIAAGGLTFGAGALIGGVLGAFGARELTRAYNLARGAETGSVRWSEQFLEERVGAALVRYLAVAHFGRGRGEFVTGTAPAHWQQAVAAAVEKRREALGEAWAHARERRDAAGTRALLLPELHAAGAEVLVSLYPDAAELFAPEGGG